MPQVEFIMNDIADISKIYEITECEDRGLGPGVLINYRGKEYCADVISSLQSNMPLILNVEYKGSLERIANEVYVLTTSAKQYIVALTLDTYEHKKSRMVVRIDSVIGANSNNCQQNDTYDSVLEQLKIKLKDSLLRDWNTCVWIFDVQSEVLCSFLYPLIFKLENKMRAFASKVLIHHLGINWMEQLGLEKYLASHKELTGDFKRHVREFANIDDRFISMTLETMLKVIKSGMVYETEISIPDDAASKIHKKIADNNTNGVYDLICGMRKVKIRFWEDIFAKYFGDIKSLPKIITDFVSDRNHIAHNKLMTWSAHQIIKSNIEAVDRFFTEANQRFEESVPSEEMYMTWDAESEMERDAAEEEAWERDYIRIQIAGQTGIEIRYEDAIFDLFREKLDEIFHGIDDTYYFDPSIHVSEQYSIENVYSEQLFFSIVCRAHPESSISVYVEMSIDDSMDGDSELYIECRSSDEKTKIANATVHYHNGAGYIDTFEGTVELESESYVDDEALSQFNEVLETYIQTTLNPFAAKLEELKMEVARYGGDLPVADFECFECEKMGVSINNDFFPFGKCCYCGAENDVYICEKCGKAFGEDGGDLGLCNECLANTNVE